MYYVNKIVGWCLSPMGLFFLALALALALCRCGGRRPGLGRAGRAIAVAACLTLWLFSTGAFMRLVGFPLEGDEVELDAAAMPRADAIVLLGGGMMVHNECGAPEICSAADRVWTAAWLHRQGKAPVVIASGRGALAEIALMNDLGVDTNKVIRLEDPRNTEEEATVIAGALKGSGGREDAGRESRIILVTSAWHMPRAKMLFERKGLDVIPAPTDYEFHAMAEEGWSFGDFLPNAEALWRNTYAAKEWVARTCYRVKR